MGLNPLQTGETGRAPERSLEALVLTSRGSFQGWDPGERRHQLRHLPRLPDEHDRRKYGISIRTRLLPLELLQGLLHLRPCRRAHVSPCVAL
ncbi:hypothetical protein VPH35_071616 [Triticum aestivum]